MVPALTSSVEAKYVEFIFLPVKSPLPSLNTRELGVAERATEFAVTVNVTAPEPLYDPEPLIPVPVVFKVKVLRLFPRETPDIVEEASFEIAIEAEALISALTIVPTNDNLLYAIDPASILFVTVPVSPVATKLPLEAGMLMALILVIPVNAKFADALLRAIEVVPTNREELPKTPEGIVPVN